MKHYRPIILSVLAFSLFLPVSNTTADGRMGADLMNEARREIIGYKINPERLGEFRTDAGRATFVSHVHRYCLGLQKTVPKNSPAETDWLNGEMNSGSVDRMERARVSVEYARWRMGMLIDDCFRWVDVYQEAERGTGRYVVGNTGALIELGRAFGGHLEFAQELVNTLDIDELTLHSIMVREIMDLSLVAAHRTVLD